MRLIRLVVAASSSVLSVDDETKMNRKKHEGSLLEALSDVGSTPTASTISHLISMYYADMTWVPFPPASASSKPFWQREIFQSRSGASQ